eukprot:752899-Hanusia_phi.AAC.4
MTEEVPSLVLVRRVGAELFVQVFKHDRDGDKELDFQDFLKIVNAGMNNQHGEKEEKPTAKPTKKRIVGSTGRTR